MRLDLMHGLVDFIDKIYLAKLFLNCKQLLRGRRTIETCLQFLLNVWIQDQIT